MFLTKIYPTTFEDDTPYEAICGLSTTPLGVKVAKIKSSVLSGTWLFFWGCSNNFPLKSLLNGNLNFAPMASGNHAYFLDVILAVVAMPNYVLRRCPERPGYTRRSSHFEALGGRKWCLVT